MSKLETNTIDTISGTSTLQVGDGNVATINLGKSGDTINVPTGATLTVPSGGLSGQNYPAFEAYLSANQSVGDAVDTKVQINTELFDTNGYYDNTTNYRFTPLVAGKYYFYGSVYTRTTTSGNLEIGYSYLYKNGAIYREQVIQFTNNPGRQASVFVSAIIDMNGSSDYMELYGNVNTGSIDNGEFASYNKGTYFGAYRIGD